MTLTPGLIFEVALAAGIVLLGNGPKRACRCPFHDDRHKSAFLSINNVFYCSRCTPDGGLSAKAFSEALGVPWIAPAGTSQPMARPRPRPVAPKAEAQFGPAEAEAVWNASYARARDDEHVDDDREVYDYLASRRLLEALELGALGIMPTDGLPTSIAYWPSKGYRVVAPLFDERGQVVSIQARAIVSADLKTRNPKGSRVAGTVFADRAGQRVLAGERTDRVVFGEGLTDMLALAITSPWPVLTAPGTSNAANAVGPWASGAEVLLALDCDGAGEEAVIPVSRRLYKHGARRVRRVRWPRGINDACEFLAQRGDAALYEWLVSHGSAVSL